MGVEPIAVAVSSEAALTKLTTLSPLYTVQETEDYITDTGDAPPSWLTNHPLRGSDDQSRSSPFPNWETPHLQSASHSFPRGRRGPRGINPEPWGYLNAAFGSFAFW